MKNFWHKIVITEICLCYRKVEYVIGSIEDVKNYCKWIEEDPFFRASIRESFLIED